jgi:acetyl/propionyl-CoA carboxylase alpha subunit
MFNKILIANRREIACRVIKTARRMGIRTVAVYSEADAEGARHVRLADEAVCIGPPPPRESYLVVDKIIDAALATGAQAIHPGYGFLSENEALPRPAPRNGIVFVGPPVSVDPRHGLKSESQEADGKGRRAADAGLPRRQPGPRLSAKQQADRHRLSGADQGQRRRRRQGHARSSKRARTSRHRWPRASARRNRPSATSACWSSAT